MPNRQLNTYYDILNSPPRPNASAAKQSSGFTNTPRLISTGSRHSRIISKTSEKFKDERSKFPTREKLKASTSKTDEQDHGCSDEDPICAVPIEEKICDLVLHRSGYRAYSDQALSKALDMKIQTMLEDLVRFNHRAYQRGNIKQVGYSGRHLIFGLHEILKCLELPNTKLKAIVIAPDIEVSNHICYIKNLFHADHKSLDGILDSILEMSSHRTTNGIASSPIPIIFALNKHILGKLSMKNSNVSAIGLLNVCGSHESLSGVIEMSQHLRTIYNTERKELYNVLVQLSMDDKFGILNHLKSKDPALKSSLRKYQTQVGQTLDLLAYRDRLDPPARRKEHNKSFRYNRSAIQ